MAMKILVKLYLCLLLAIAPVYSHAEETVKARLNENSSHLTYSPLVFSDGSNLTLVTPRQFNVLIKHLSATIQDLHQRLKTVFGNIPQFSTSIHLMEESKFFQETNAPEWTNALYYKNKIIIPISQKINKIEYKSLIRAVKHEYTHAVVNALSRGRCAGWLDEGIAQWAEGYESVTLRKALITQLKVGDLLPLSKLQGGFTGLKPEIVPIAYAQSLYLTRALINHYGFYALRNYFKALRIGYSQDAAFITAFNVNEPLLEVMGTKKLRKKFKIYPQQFKKDYKTKR